MGNHGFARREFLGAAAMSLACAAWGGERPNVSRPRATDGDDAHEPDWAERLSISVGPKDADLVGKDDRVLQAAVDYATRLGGGTVRILPGTYTLRNAVYLPSKVRLLGSGEDSILTKIASQSVALAEDSDWYDQEITLANGNGFRVGDGIVLRAKNVSNQGQLVIKRTIVARDGNRLKLSDGLRENLWLEGKPTCASLFPLLTSERTADVVIENLTLDGNGTNNENFDGNYGGCIFLQDCNRYQIRRVTARNYNGDGISFQVCHDVSVEECHSHGHRGLGLHPGSGSQRPTIRNNRLVGNSIGLFWCWGVKYGLAEGNTIDANRDYGISIGHNDTDNLMRNNRVTNSGKVGVLFRDDRRGQDFWANRNTLENNSIENSGGPEGIAIDIQGQTKDTRLTGNEVRETRGAMRRIGIRIAAAAGAVDLSGNSISGFAQEMVDQRKA